ncbi:DUF1045 domain-containing protein [Rhizobium sp. G187]|uniref:DUF1045 domain-containing protein n=1 Tax=Rhizobium sp. G187 TaxID=3451352 RepID=UPI003EE7EE2B
MRYAIYFTPSEDHPLTRAAAEWLGRDAFSGEALPQLLASGFERPELAELTADPRRYGFHATLKAPFHLKDEMEEADLLDAFRSFCTARQAFDIPGVMINRIGPFFAIVPAETHGPLQDFAASVVEAFEPFRAPLSADDMARRKPERLTDSQRQYLTTWGYPYVFDDFRFHMTLSGPVPDDRAPVMAEGLEAHFSAFTNRALRIDGLALFVEPERGAPFQVHSWQPLAAPTNG